jgi:hypothetical protein
MRLTMLPDLNAQLNAVGGAALVIVGLALLRVRPRRTPLLALTGFLLTFGLGFIASNLLSGDEPLWASVYATSRVLLVGSAAMLVVLGLSFPRALGHEDRRLALASGAVAAAYVVVVAVVLWPSVPGPAPSLGPLTPTDYRYGLFVANLLLSSGFWFALTLAALRFATTRGPAMERDRQQLALISAALLLFPAYSAGHSLRNVVFSSVMSTGAEIVPVLLVGILWVANTRVTEPRARRGARNLAMLAFAMPVVGLALSPVAAEQIGSAFGARGLLRIVMALFLAYAILRQQLLDIDVKVKWTISRGTLAATFIAVFFVVTQVAQNYLQQYGVLAGGAAAGLLLFALAPLQRFAESVANVAMPGTKPVSQMGASEREAAYREAVRVTWSDGVLTRDERGMLRGLQQAYGLRDEQAQRIEREVECAQEAC